VAARKRRSGALLAIAEDLGFGAPQEVRLLLVGQFVGERFEAATFGSAFRLALERVTTLVLAVRPHPRKRPS